MPNNQIKISLRTITQQCRSAEGPKEEAAEATAVDLNMISFTLIVSLIATVPILIKSLVLLQEALWNCITHFCAELMCSLVVS